MSNIKFLDSKGLTYLWGKIKDNFASKLEYKDGELYLVDGLGQRLDYTIDTHKFGAVKVSSYAELEKYARTEYIGMTLYLDTRVTEGESTYETGAYIVTGSGPASGLLRLAASTSTGDVEDAINALSGRVSQLEGKLENVTFDNFATKDELNSKVDTNTFNEAVKSFITKDEVTDMISDIPVKSVKSDDKIISLGENGELSSILTFGMEEGHIVLSGKDGVEIGSVDTSDFVVDGMLESVEFSKEPGKENTLVMTFNAAADKKEIEIDFGKYVDAYSAGEGIKLSEKVFSINWDTVASKENLTVLGNKVTEIETKLSGVEFGDFVKTETLESYYTKEEVDAMMPVALTEGEIDNAINESNS